MVKNRSKKRSNASHMRQTALNAFDLVEEDNVDVRAQRRMGRAKLDEEAPHGGDSDGFDSEHDYLNDDVKSEDDEEIDSDEAFGSEDDFDFEEFKNSGKSFKKINNKSKTLNLNEDSDSSDEEEAESDASIDESEFIPLSQVWDMDESQKAKAEKKTLKPTKALRESKSAVQTVSHEEDEEVDDLGSDISESILSGSGSDDSGSESGSESELSDSDLSGSDLSGSDLSIDSDIDEIDEVNLSKLRSQIAESAASLREPVQRKKRKLQVNNLTEGEFNVPSSKKLSFADLAGSIGSQSAKKSLVLLPELTKKTKVTEDGRSKSKLALDIPLAKRIQDRYNRGAAFEVAKEEVEKWTETVKKNRTAEHLQFPINPQAPVISQSTHTPIAASNDMERKVNEMLVESSLANEQQLTNFEELAPTKLSMEEVRKRRNELRMMRELLFREEQKAKRIKKIKSKTYRKIHRKEKERIKALVEGEEENDEDKEDHDMQRARERMTLKHKTTGKWAKRMVEQGITKDKSMRSEMEEMLRQGESLRKKIMGEERKSDSSDDGSSGSDDDDNESEIFSDAEEAAQVKNKLQKGVLGMSFMKEAEAKQRQRNLEQRDLLRRAEAGEDILDSDDNSHFGANIVLNEGRRQFTPGTTQSRDSMQDVVDSVKRDMADESTLSSRLRDKFQQTKGAVKGSRPQRVSDAGSEPKDGEADISMDVATLVDSHHSDDTSEKEAEDGDENPWLTASSTKLKSRKSSKLAVTHANNTINERQQQAIKKQKSQTRKEQSSDVTIDVQQTLKIVDPYGDDEDEGEDEGHDQDDDGMIVVPKTKNKKLSFKQKELVKRAFAGDDVVEEFQEEKRQKTQDEGNKELDVTLPGWGSWGGTGLTPKRRFVEKVKGVDAAKRKDAKLKDVIISEKVNKKNAKYNSSSVPFPFENREQYERSLQLPIGQEWSSKTTFQKLTKPKVIVKPGVVIDPLKAPFQ